MLTPSLVKVLTVTGMLCEKDVGGFLFISLLRKKPSCFLCHLGVAGDAHEDNILILKILSSSCSTQSASLPQATGSCYVAQAGLELNPLTLAAWSCWDYRYESPDRTKTENVL